MPIHSKNKGSGGEREVAEMIRRAGFFARRGQQFAGSPDSPDVVHDLPVPFHLEVKRTERLNIYEAWEQACKDAGWDEIPCVVHRRSKKKWLCVFEFERLLMLVKMIQDAGDRGVLG